ncbi:Methyltransferase domain-containing protein [Anaerovirgula multivorans]|uniref:Methyltransferase domain-containing protein n=1 Tax=Anaerovirgula multivorans TaxID=312168 RepID=A0A239IZW9_9FIRM|nr:class I SAM-dependent methyltransferase [Anaerovirgula multivorans]SNS99167.1 Methyltransferase domain-containing protein [Anaerovirgula multivorans]
MVDRKRVCPAEQAGSLDNGFRRFFQNPSKILKPYIKDGMTVLDLGCGPGFFSVEMAKMVGKNGKVIAVDVQEEMLEKLKNKIKGTKIEKRIKLHRCEENRIGVTDKVDFILAFYMVHEVPNQEILLREIISILKPNGKAFIVEPKFHVSKEVFEETKKAVKRLGFEIINQPKLFMSRGIVFKNAIVNTSKET